MKRTLEQGPGPQELEPEPQDLQHGEILQNSKVSFSQEYQQVDHSQYDMKQSSAERLSISQEYAQLLEEIHQGTICPVKSCGFVLEYFN